MSVISDYDELKGLVTECVNEALELAKKQEKTEATKSKKSVADLVEEKINNYGIRR